MVCGDISCVGPDIMAADVVCPPPEDHGERRHDDRTQLRHARLDERLDHRLALRRQGRLRVRRKIIQ